MIVTVGVGCFVVGYGCSLLYAAWSLRNYTIKERLK